MSSIPVPPETPLLRSRPSSRLRDSMAAQIALAISVTTVLLMLVGCWLVGRLLEQEFTALPLAIPEVQRDAFIERAWRAMFWTLAAGAFATAILAWYITQRILASVKRLGDTANRIGAQALHERLPADAVPAELAPAALAFNAMLGRLQDAFARLSGFSSDLAHDLRAPIHRLLTATQVTLAQPRSADEYRAVLESAVTDYERIGRLIENILFLARADHAQTRLHADWHSMRERLTGMVEFFELLAEDRGLTLALDVQPGLRAWADDVLFARAVGNLLTNALRHARPGSTVQLSAHALAPGFARITVANEGEPIDPAHQADIFQRRYRIENPATEAGSGLGLAIVKSVMDLHGGRVGVRSAPGLPTVFTLDFPPPARRRVDFRQAARRSAH
ncbi:heavy metal sensor histidine kinase [Pseudorhodoferax sp.]|uniref:heavy metal sensor histidine kinase n=1 Tax=Pseudorhodoferax sp. TaxID=1993553 RepID=UPI002DD6382C|nr:heavy metal sensor histidine kinase [Pseudorhodoferax sp.]